MGWRTIVINQHSKLTYKHNHFVFSTVERTELIHLSEIDVVIMETTDITITTMLIKRLIDENVLVIFCDDKRLPIAHLMPYYGRHDSSLQLNRQMDWSSEVKEKVWSAIIAQKILNQSILLSNRGYIEKASAVRKLQHELKPFDPTNREGHAARIYFNTLFGNQFTRQTDNDINAALDYGYTLLMSLFAREIVKSGCMTQLGLKHRNQFNQFNLASDIMEPFRPLVDQIVYENSHERFAVIKRELFTLFTTTFLYQKKQMYLTNIVSDYTKKVIKTLNNGKETIPSFRI